ncbi:MAG: hypothetical protein AAGC96_00470 [Pseudomonadota bacterium]
MAHPVLEDMSPTELGDLYFDPTVIEEGPKAATGKSHPQIAGAEPQRTAPMVLQPSRTA